MLLLPLVLGAFVPVAGPGPSVRVPDLAHVARLSASSRRDRGPVAEEPGTETAEYAIESAANGSQVFVLPPGPRTVRALEVIPTSVTAGAWRDARLRLTWEGDDPHPALAGIDLPFGLAFGRARALPPVESLAVGTMAGAWVNRLPMPYRTRALLRVDTDARLDGRIRVRTTRGADPDAGFLRAAVWTNPGRLAESGRGHLVGIFVECEGPRPDHGPRLVVDGKPVGPLAAALGWVDKRSPSYSPFRDGSASILLQGGSFSPRARVGGFPARTAAYAWRVTDPVTFDSSFSVEAGADPVAASPAVSQTAAVFWYSEDPRPRRGAR